MLSLVAHPVFACPMVQKVWTLWFTLLDNDQEIKEGTIMSTFFCIMDSVSLAIVICVRYSQMGHFFKIGNWDGRKLEEIGEIGTGK
ncbi:hypothetical protein EPICR_10459 [Candidatus Desulfarcum epimagneticum]|uniref:Uncharacterized protein n=1 Tax=uncultured Desulfobacteraceae bacterium TaxID=218296 RepID=A0A484HEP0_9BACT|nr:hypothetical protein EPICR_10459 [uncultured Desulfobacteraceae bacterium]